MALWLALVLMGSSSAFAGVGRWTERGPQAASFYAVAVDPEGTVYAGSSLTLGRSVFKSSGALDRWSAADFGIQGLGVNQIVADPVARTLYLVSQLGSTPADGKIFASQDGGDHWIRLPLDQSVFCVAGATVSGTTVLYAGLYAGGESGLWRSSDRGATWSPIAALAGGSSLGVFVDRAHPDTVVSTLGVFGGSFRTTDGWQTWSTFPEGVFAVDPSDPSILYGMGGGGVEKSSDGGATWSPIGAPAGTFKMSVDPRDGRRVFAVTGPELWRSIDAGATWQREFVTSGFLRDVAVDPSDSSRVVAADQGEGVVVSLDGGVTWTRAAGLLRPDVFSLAAGPLASGPVYAGNTGCGLSRSEDGARSWCCLGSDVPVVSVSPFDGYEVYGLASAGPYAGTLVHSFDGGSTWQPTSLAGAAVVGFDPTDPLRVYANGSGLLRSDDRGQSWAPLAPLLYGSVFSFAIDASSPSTLYATSYQCAPGFPLPCSYLGYSIALSRSTDRGARWTSLPLPAPFALGAHELPRVFVAPWDAQSLFVLASQGAYLSRDLGATWTLVEPFISSLLFDPAHPGIAYGVGYPERIMRSVDGGVHWAEFNEGLEISIPWTVVTDASGSVLRAATQDAGVQEYELPQTAVSLATSPADEFLVTLTATDPSTGRATTAVAGRHENDSTVFRFPELTGDLENPEAFVKILDGRSLTGSFWIFWGRLTSLTCTLTVTEKSTGRVRQYSIGGNDCSTFDTQAFPSPAGSSPASRPTSVCAAEPDLLLDPGHPFRVTLGARDPRTGVAAVGLAARDSDRFGTFSLPDLTGDTSNPEVFIKIVDGRAVNGRFWVFYGAVTDVEYDLTVTDDATGVTQVYRTDAGTGCGGFDTTTFGD